MCIWICNSNTIIIFRDPNIVNTLNAYDEAWTALAPAGDGSYTISDEEITEAVIGSIGKFHFCDLMLLNLINAVLCRRRY